MGKNLCVGVRQPFSISVSTAYKQHSRRQSKVPNFAPVERRTTFNFQFQQNRRRAQSTQSKEWNATKAPGVFSSSRTAQAAIGRRPRLSPLQVPLEPPSGRPCVDRRECARTREAPSLPRAFPTLVRFRRSIPLRPSIDLHRIGGRRAVKVMRMTELFDQGQYRPYPRTARFVSPRRAMCLRDKDSRPSQDRQVLGSPRLSNPRSSRNFPHR